MAVAPTAAPDELSQAHIEPTDDASGLPEKAMLSATTLANFIWSNYQDGLNVRRPFAREWMKILSIMKDNHYFRIEGDKWVPLMKKPGQIRAITPIMQPMYDIQMGRLTANKLGITTIPKPGRDANGYHQSNVARALMSDWMEQADIEGFDDTFTQHLLYYGMAGIYRYIDQFRKQVFVESIPGSELFPIPFDAVRMDKAEGIMRVVRMPRQWLEEQDQLYFQQYGQFPSRRMVEQAGSQKSWLTINSSGFASASQWGKEVEGATVIWFWLKPTKRSDNGQVGLMVEEKLYRYRDGPHPQTGEMPLFGGKIPIELSYYTKLPDSFWGRGFLQTQTAPQLEANRQYTNVIKAAAQSPDILAYNSSAGINVNDIDSKTTNGLVAFTSTGDERTAPIFRIPGTQITQEMGAVLQLAQAASEKGGNMTSSIIFGEQSGRTEGGPATSLLDTRANQPLDPVLNRKFRALKITYDGVLDMIKTVWGPERMVPAIGKQNLARELVVRQQDIPASRDVLLFPTPMTPGGRHSMLQMVLTLRQMPAPDGGFELSSREFRRALQELGMAPPGIDLVNQTEQRILWRIEMIIGDLQQPSKEFIPASQDGRQRFEDHRAAVDLIREAILDPGASAYGKAVAQAFGEELQYHMDQMNPPAPDIFEDGLDKMDMVQVENALDFAEQDPDTTEGQFITS